MTLALVIFLAFTSLAGVKAEPDLNKRSELALLNADQKLDDARQANRAGKIQALEADLQEIGDSVALCYASLQETHKPPRKSKYYKRAELKISELMRRLNGFQDDVGYDVRANVAAVLMKISNIHDQLISDIMSRKKD